MSLPILRDMNEEKQERERERQKMGEMEEIQNKVQSSIKQDISNKKEEYIDPFSFEREIERYSYNVVVLVFFVRIHTQLQLQMASCYVPILKG